MAEFNRDIRITAKIVFYCEKIEQASLGWFEEQVELWQVKAERFPLYSSCMNPIIASVANEGSILSQFCLLDWRSDVVKS